MDAAKDGLNEEALVGTTEEWDDGEDDCVGCGLEKLVSEKNGAIEGAWVLVASGEDGGDEFKISPGLFEKLRVGSNDGADEIDGIFVGNFEGTYEGMFDDVGNEDKLGVSVNEIEGNIDDLLEGFADE